MQCLFNIIGRSSIACAIFIFSFVDLCQRTFHKCGSRADDAHQPHPEAGARPAQTDGCRYPDNISCADTGCGRNHQRLKGGNLSFSGRLHDKPAGFPKQPKLYAPCQNCKAASCNRHYYDQYRIVHDAVYRVQCFQNYFSHK